MMSACCAGVGINSISSPPRKRAQYVPASKRGWITGVTTTRLPAGLLLGALLGKYLAVYIGWRGMFAIGLLPALVSLLFRAWVPESPHWLLSKGRLEDARRSLAWALMIDPRQIDLPRAVETPALQFWAAFRSSF